MMTIIEETEKYLIINYFTQALEEQMIKINNIQWKKEGTGRDAFEQKYTLTETFKDVETYSQAITIFQQKVGNLGKWNIRLDETERTYIIAKVILLFFINHGKFIKDQFNQYYYFSETDDSVTLVCESSERKKMCVSFESIIENTFNLRRHYNNVHNKILNYVLSFNESMNIYRLWFFDKEKNVLYVYAGGKTYFKLDGEKITVHTNGEDVLFKESDSINHKQYLPIDQRRDIGFIPGLYKNCDHPLFDILVNRVNFSQESNLTPDEQRVQLIIQILILPFSSIIHTKPIMLFRGVAGSGKSITLQTIGKFLFGDGYALSLLPDQIKDYTTALINRPVYFTDNVDTYIKWLAELIVAISTGARLPQRGLYTNHDLIENLPECFLAFTSRTGNSFKREDVIDRALLFYVDRIELNLTPTELWGPLKYNDELFSQYLDILNKIVNYIKKDNTSIRTTHRIAGWVKFGHMVNKILGLEELYTIKFPEFLEHIHNEKAVFSFLDKTIIKYLRIFCNTNSNEWFYAREIIEKIEEFEPDFNYDSSKLGKILNTQKKALNTIFGLNIQLDSHSKSKQYKFGKESGVKKSTCKKTAVDREVKYPTIALRKKIIKKLYNKDMSDFSPRPTAKNRKISEHAPKIQKGIKDIESYLSHISRVDGVRFDDMIKYFVYHKKWEKSFLEYLLDQMCDNYGDILRLVGNRYQICR